MATGLTAMNRSQPLFSTTKIAARNALKGSRPDQAMLRFMGVMEELFMCSIRERMNIVNMAAIITAMSQLLSSAHDNPRFSSGHRYVRQQVSVLYQRCIKHMQPLLPNSTSREVSNILWASANLKLNPDDYVPGTVKALCGHFLDSIVMGYLPTCQITGNVMWALATMAHPAATPNLIEALCCYVVRLLDGNDIKAQEISNIVWSLATLKHPIHRDRVLIDKLCKVFLQLIQAEDVTAQPNAQEVANMLWALGTLRHVPAVSADFFSRLFNHLETLLLSSDNRDHPKAQEIANAVWALGVFKYMQSPLLMTSLERLCKHFVLLLGSAEHRARPKAQEISNLLWALGQLSLCPLSKHRARRAMSPLSAVAQQPGAAACPHSTSHCQHTLGTFCFEACTPR